MGYPREVYDRAWGTLSRRRREARELTERRREEILREVPEIARIERSLAATASSVAKSIVSRPGAAAELIGRLRDENLALQERRASLLKERGYPADYLAERHSCAECGDTGYIGDRMCGCLRGLLRSAAYEELGAASQAANCTFGNFLLDYYPDAPDPSGAVPRVRMGRILELCRNYARDFTPAADSLLMLGLTGLGKTHLSLAIASEVTGAGYGVVYTPVQRLMDKLESEKFARAQDAREQYTESMEHVLDCDLLVLDDLGTEFHTQFTTSVLYNIVNTRLVEGRPTIINTNLELARIEEKYSQRMVSRLACSYRVLKFYGKDVRFIRKQGGL